jgi:bacillithiol biosynthesis deacetylase BshB1
MSLEPVDLLVFGPHPDDLEIGLGGTIAKHAALGHRVGLCDLTRGELGSNGTPEGRIAESERAREVLGAAWRVNLGLPDGGLDPTDGHVRAIASLVRRARPSAIGVPFEHDRHPDHGAAYRLLRLGIFRAGLRRFDTGEPAWTPEWTCAYFINDSVAPSFVVDVSDHYDAKRAALACHVSQFTPEAPGSARTRLTSPLFLKLIESRDAQLGAQAGVAFAEGVVVREPIVRAGLLHRWPAAGPA